MREQYRLHPEWIQTSFEHNRENHNGILYVQTPEGIKTIVAKNKSNHEGIMKCQTLEFAEFMREQHRLHPEWQQFGQEVIRNNRGGLHNMQTEEGKINFIKSYNSNPEKYQSKRLMYDGVSFDSIPELSFYIFCKMNWIPIIRIGRDVYFEYTNSDGEKFYSYPDFIINNNQIVEMKGGHFFNSDGVMIYPYNKLHKDGPLFTPEEKRWYNDKYARKQKCLLEHNVLIIRDDSDYMKYVINFVKTVYFENCKEWYKRYNVKEISFIGNGRHPFNTDYSKEYQEPIDIGKTPFDI